MFPFDRRSYGADHDDFSLFGIGALRRHPFAVHYDSSVLLGLQLAVFLISHIEVPMIAQYS